MYKIPTATFVILLLFACKGSSKVEEAKVVPPLSKERCDWVPNSGPCRGALDGFFYDSRTKKCQKFQYGGCQGVLPFESLSDCEKACK